MIEIFPQIEYPDEAIYGVIKCFFFATVPARECTYNNDHDDRTLITVYTPLNYDFKESEIPITITTEGA